MKLGSNCSDYCQNCSEDELKMMKLKGYIFAIETLMIKLKSKSNFRDQICS